MRKRWRVLCSKHVYNKSIAVAAAPLRNLSGMYEAHTHNCVEKCSYINIYIDVLCVYAWRGRVLSFYCLSVSPFRALLLSILGSIWVLARSPERTFPAACPRIAIKYLVYKCVRPYPLFFIQYLCNFFAISARFILFFQLLLVFFHIFAFVSACWEFLPKIVHRKIQFIAQSASKNALCSRGWKRECVCVCVCV